MTFRRNSCAHYCRDEIGGGRVLNDGSYFEARLSPVSSAIVLGGLKMCINSSHSLPVPIRLEENPHSSVVSRLENQQEYHIRIDECGFVLKRAYI